LHEIELHDPGFFVDFPSRRLHRVLSRIDVPFGE